MRSAKVDAIISKRKQSADFVKSQKSTDCFKTVFKVAFSPINKPLIISQVMVQSLMQGVYIADIQSPPAARPLHKRIRIPDKPIFS